MAKLNRIKVVLVEKQKTGKWLAEQVGKSACTVSKWCSNSTQPEIAQLKRVAYLLEQLDSLIYVDWLDSSMPQTTCGKIAENIKEKIKKDDKFILVATEGAIASKWCIWELGFGDAHKYASEKIALFPIRNEGYDWSESEYLEIYPVIGYIDTYQYVSNFGCLDTGYNVSLWK